MWRSRRWMRRCRSGSWWWKRVDVEVERAEVLVPDKDDASRVSLARFAVTMDAKAAQEFLEEAGVVAELRPQRYPDSDVYTGLLEIVVDRADQEAAVRILHKQMGLFPKAEVDERGEDESEGGEELFSVGVCEVAEDAERMKAALQGAGIWFKAEVGTGEPEEETGEVGVEGTYFSVKCADAERAMEVIGEAFSGEAGE